MRQPIFDRLESEGRLGPMKKYAHSELEGKFALLTDSDLGEFKEFEDARKKLAVILEFSREDAGLLDERIIQPLIGIEQSLGLEFSLVGRDMPFHCTVLTGKASQEGGLSEVKEEVIDSPVFNEMCQKILGTEVNYGLLLYEKTNLLLTATKIPEIIRSARQFLKDKYAEKGLKPAKSLDDFLHCTISRMTKLPPPDSRLEIFNQYLEALQPLRAELTKNPLHFKPQGVYVGSLADFVKKGK